MIAEERFDELVSHYLDEALEEEGLRELNALLAARPDLARRFLRLGRVHSGVRELGVSEGSRPRARWSSRATSGRSRQRHAWGIAAAGLLLLLLLFILFVWLRRGL